jgi:hypothetical protein
LIAVWAVKELKKENNKNIASPFISVGPKKKVYFLLFLNI